MQAALGRAHRCRPMWALLLLALVAVDWLPQHARGQKLGQAVYGFFRVNDKIMLEAIRTGTPAVSLKITGVGKATVPPSFLGLSYEVNNARALRSSNLQKVFRHLMSFNTGPLILRVGGLSSDREGEAYAPPDVLAGLKSVTANLNTRLILGLSLWAERPDVPKRQLQRIKSQVPQDKVLSYTIGNEPDMYTLPCTAGSCEGSQKPKDFVAKKWVPLSRDLYSSVSKDTGKKLGGPSWSTLRMRPGVLEWWLSGTKNTINMVTVHHYNDGADASANKRSNEMAELLSDGTLRDRMSNLRALVGVARSAGVPLRITESGSLSYGGFQGVCNTLAAGLWVADTAMKAAEAGAAGIHYHQTVAKTGNANYNAIENDPADLNRVRVKPPYAGFWLFQAAVSGGAQIMEPYASGNTQDCKPWMLKGTAAGDFRLMVLNRNLAGKRCIVRVELDRWVLEQYEDNAVVDYITAANGLKEEWTVYFSNQAFPLWGADVAGRREPFVLRRWEYPGGRAGGLYFMLPEGTQAALMVLKRRKPGNVWKPVPRPKAPAPKKAPPKAAVAKKAPASKAKAPAKTAPKAAPVKKAG